MFTLTYKQLASRNLTDAMRKITQADLPAKKAYELAKLTQKLESAIKQVMKEFQTEVLPLSPKEGESSEAYDKALEAFEAKTYTIERNKLPFSFVMSIRLSAADFTGLEPLIDDSDTETTESVMAKVMNLNGTPAELPQQ